MLNGLNGPNTHAFFAIVYVKLYTISRDLRHLQRFINTLKTLNRQKACQYTCRSPNLVHVFRSRLVILTAKNHLKCSFASKVYALEQSYSRFMPETVSPLEDISSLEPLEPVTVYQRLLFLPLMSRNLSPPSYSASQTSEYHTTYGDFKSTDYP